MATGREARDGRLNERLRGAQRVIIGDDTGFNIDIGGDASQVAEDPGMVPEEVPAEPSPEAPPPNDTVRPDRRNRLDLRLRGAQRTNIEDNTGLNLNIDGIALPFGTSSPRSSRQSSSPIILKGRRHDTGGATTNAMLPPPPRGTARQSTSPGSREHRSSSVIRPSPGHQTSSPIFPTEQRRRSDMNLTDEVLESPVQFPGSGRRVASTTDDVTNTTAMLYGAVASSGNLSDISSPLVGKSKPSKVATNRSAMYHVQRPVSDASDDRVSEARVSPPRPQGEPDSPDQEEAEEMDEAETAKFFGLKRRRPTQPARSPRLGSDDTREDVSRDEVQPHKRQKGRPVASPATQRQPKKRSAGASRPPKATSVRSGASRRSASGDDAAVEVTVQRFINNRREGEDDDSDDPLQENIPFANKATETVVDVLAQVCEEVIETTLGQLRRLANTTSDSAKQKEYRIKMKAIEAYREELSSRLLQHAIHLNHWHSLRKRLRHVQKQKLDLRDEILRIRGEREQVALQMDAIRIKHENDTKDSKQRLATSNTMFGIELAVQQGREELDMSPREQKEADIANLGLLISQVSDQASSSAATGGIFNQLRDFNAFLERAALALEAR